MTGTVETHDASHLRGLVSAISRDLGDPGKVIGESSGGKARFTLFNGPNSICSQKTRVVLSQLGLPYESFSVNMFAGQTYLPNYVRLRMIGCKTAGLPLMTFHEGSTSVTSGGCDPAVVPALIDWSNGSIIVDSKRICLYVDTCVPRQDGLIPDALTQAILAELDIVDNLPNYQILIGRPPYEDNRPESRRGDDGLGIAMGKVERCDRYLAEYADDPVLVEAYSAKRAKELAGARQLFSPERMAKAYAIFREAIDGLEARLERHAAPYLFSTGPTMADLFWAIELQRLANLGATDFWQDGHHPAVQRFFKSSSALPSIRSSIIDWPGALY
jgi:2,5-dichlorohydroquinone reductive dechlorinase